MGKGKRKKLRYGTRKQKFAAQRIRTEMNLKRKGKTNKKNHGA